MKAYVIKNKEGKYKEPHLDIREFYTDILAEAEIWIERKDAEYFCPQDCEVVEITITEGDLEQELNKYKSLYIENEKVVDYQHDKLSEKDKEIEELKTRVSELQDKDWYEACIKQLEEQNDKLIKERDEMQKELETSVDYWKNEVFKKIEVKLTGVTKEKIQEIRKQVCDEIREKAEVFGTGVTGILGYMVMIPLLDQIEKGEKNNGTTK